MILNRCADQRPAWAEVRIVSNGLKRGQTVLNCGLGGLENRNNHNSATGYLRLQFLLTLTNFTAPEKTAFLSQKTAYDARTMIQNQYRK